MVADGTWRQTTRMVRRDPTLSRLPRIRLPEGPPSRYRLRTHPDPARVSTLEAIARALGVLEGADVQRRLEALFDIMVERTLWTRGELPEPEVSGGIPDKRW